MAHCSVLEADQNPTDRPSKRIKRSGGHSLVRRGLAVWIREHVLLQMRPERRCSGPIDMASKHTPNGVSGRCSSRYIPEKLPSHKTPGTKAKGPVVEQTPECRKHLMTARIFAASAEGLKVGVTMKGLISEVSA